MMGDGTEPLAVQMARFEERMKTMQAEYKTDIARLAEDNAKRETRLIAAIAGRERWLIGIMGIMLALSVAVLGVLIRF